MTAYDTFQSAVDALLALPDAEQRAHLERRFSSPAGGSASGEPLLLRWNHTVTRGRDAATSAGPTPLVAGT